MNKPLPEIDRVPGLSCGAKLMSNNNQYYFHYQAYFTNGVYVVAYSWSR